MKTEPPLIGMPCRHDTSTVYNQEKINAQSEAYLSALSQAGGIPFLIPLTFPPHALRRSTRSRSARNHHQPLGGRGEKTPAGHLPGYSGAGSVEWRDIVPGHPLADA
jgi:hypothetical protein